MRSRTGITPVVAIVILLMMTVAIAGGVFAFFSGFLDEQKDNIEGQLSFDVDVKDIQCEGTNISISLKNNGDDIDAGETTVFVYDSDNRVLESNTTDASDAGFEDANGFGTASIDVGTTFNTSQRYLIELGFRGNDKTVQTQCIAD